MVKTYLATFASLLLLLSTGCSATGAKGTESVDWSLTGVELDRSLLANAGAMPLFRRPTGTNFGGAPVAVGSFRSSDSGRAACRVVFDEPIVGLSGRVSMLRYDVVNMTGMRSEDGKTLTVGASAGTTPLGAPTELRFERKSDTILIARPYTDSTPLPYRFIFSAGVGVERPVEIPYVD